MPRTSSRCLSHTGGGCGQRVVALIGACKNYDALWCCLARCRDVCSNCNIFLLLSRMINFDCQEHAPAPVQRRPRRARSTHAADLVARNTLRAANLPALTNQATLHHGGGLECQACARYDSDGVPWYVRARLCSGPPSLTFCAAGAGKTTLLNHVLRHTPTTRIAVIENEVL